MYNVRIFLSKRLKKWALAEARRSGFSDVSGYVHDLIKQDQTTSKPSS